MISQCCYDLSGCHKPQHSVPLVWLSSQLYKPETLRVAPLPMRGRETDDIIVESDWLKKHRGHKTTGKHHNIFKFEPSVHNNSERVFFFVVVLV